LQWSSPLALPDGIAKFDGLGEVEEISKNARKIFFTMLAGCIYSWLTIATTTDAHAEDRVPGLRLVAERPTGWRREPQDLRNEIGEVLTVVYC